MPLLSRHSTPSRQLGPPGPDDSQLLAMLDAAVHVPDHGRLTPWRFVRIHGQTRHALGEALATRLLERDGQASPDKLAKERTRFEHAPCIIAVVARLTANHKIPESEQIQSGSCACFSLLLAAHEQGFGAQWLTGWAAYDPVISSLLGLSDNERILGFIHIGSIITAHADRERPDPRALLTDWQPP